MKPVITNVDEVNSEWLTEALARSGALKAGVVASFAVERGAGNWSTSASLLLTYTEDARGVLPQRLFLKMVDADTGDGEYFDDSEVRYYTHDYTDVPQAPLLRCYDAVFSRELLRYHLLLEDVSQTHVMALDRAPTLEIALALAEGLAVMHARWWGAERLAAIGAPVHDAAHVRRFVDIAEPGVAHILDCCARALEPQWPALLHQVYAQHPQAIVERASDPEAKGFTVIHGDAGGYNILVPREGVQPLYVIDRQPFDWSLTTWLGVYDLAYCTFHDWDVATRRRLEMPMLRRYHQALQANGVTGYGWEQLLVDYRLCMPMGVYIATEYCRGGVNERFRHVWLPMLQRVLTACEDLACAALW